MDLLPFRLLALESSKICWISCWILLEIVKSMNKWMRKVDLQQRKPSCLKHLAA